MQKRLAIGAILGDIISSAPDYFDSKCEMLLPYDKNNIPFNFSTSTILTIATMDCLLHESDMFSEFYIKWGQAYSHLLEPGTLFTDWVNNGDPTCVQHEGIIESILGISPIGYVSSNIEICKRLAFMSHQYISNCTESTIVSSAYVSQLVSPKPGYVLYLLLVSYMRSVNYMRYIHVPRYDFYLVLYIYSLLKRGIQPV
nr:MAG TPA: hypothetical protein [Caudoviricetes sp.]